MKYVKFTLSKGDPITLPIEIAERLINSDGQLMKIPETDGSWSGKLINKAHIVSTDLDKDRMRSEAENERMRIVKLEAPAMTDEQRQRNLKKLADIKKDLINKKVIKK
jgi:hypothetical protein